MTDITIGTDISKHHIDLHWLPDGKRLLVTNNRKGFASILTWMSGEAVPRIAYEPTGVYHKTFEHFMLTHGVALSKVNLRLARRFAEATGSLIKTDQAIAAFHRACLKITITTDVNDAPALAAAAMRLSSVSVITNALRLRRVKLDA